MADEKKPNSTLNVPVGALGLTEGSAEVSYRTHFSVTHALSAALLAREAANVEVGAEAAHPAQDTIRALATGAIMVSVAFLEGTINEFFTDMVEEKNALPQWVAVLPQQQRRSAARLWQSAAEKKWRPAVAQFQTEGGFGGAAFQKSYDPALDKFQAALAIFGCAGFDRGASPYQDAALVIDVRNAFVHAQPVTHSSDIENSTEEAVYLSNRLRPKFVSNRFMGNNAAFPDGVLGGGGAAWAFTSCLNFTDEFFRRLKIEPRYEHFRPRLACVQESPKR